MGKDCVQAFRIVHRNEICPTTAKVVAPQSKIIYLASHADMTTDKDVVFWDDILIALKEKVCFIQNGTRIVPFLKGRNFMKYVK
jgi:hypothetical protein